MDKFRRYSKELRKNMPDTERILWKYLRSRRIASAKFRRQVRIGSYIVDFICFSKNLVIELDGGQHSEQIEYDKKRTQWLNEQGFEVIRFWNNEVMENLEGVLQVIYDKCK